MKMAKASQADLDMAMEFTNAIESLSGWNSTVPQAIEQCAEEDSENFDIGNTEQCRRVLEYLIELSNRASLMRVVWGCAVMLDPENKLVDPAADTIEHHPERAQMRSALLWTLYHHQGGSSDVGQPIRKLLGIEQHERMTERQIADAKLFAEKMKGAA